jgi:hypothetical protein
MCLFGRISGVLLVLAAAMAAHSGCSSDTADVNIPAAPALPYQGTLDVANCEKIAGWAMANDKPDAPVEVEIYDGKMLLATLPADGFRDDLLKNKKGNGKHKFVFETPTGLRDGQPHEIHAKIVGTSFELKKSPKTITCLPK